MHEHHERASQQVSATIIAGATAISYALALRCVEAMDRHTDETAAAQARAVIATIAARARRHPVTATI